MYYVLIIIDEFSIFTTMMQKQAAVWGIGSGISTAREGESTGTAFDPTE